MSIRLHISEDVTNLKESELHLLPCKVRGDEPAKVSSFFKPYVRKNDEGYYDCSFRGYPLQGKKITLPDGYKGMIFMDNKKTDNENRNQNLYCKRIFSEFTYWNYDKIPSKNDALVAALDWIDIADTLHSPET